MSPSDSPDFDNMSPEEMMRWMETLAKRQGGDASGFLTDASAEVTDPTDYDERDFGPGYTPFGEKAKPAEAVSEPEPEPEPEAEPEPEPEAEPEPELELEEALPDVLSEAGGMPDFDAMSPEEAIRWMETLAKRQGGDASGFTTDASADVVDPTDYDERDFGPGYTPFGEKAKPAEAVSEPEPEPEPEAEPELAVEDDGLGWLDDLSVTSESAADDGLPDLGDLDSLSAELDGMLVGNETDDAPQDSLAWLEGLASGEMDDPEPEVEVEAQAAPEAPEEFDPLGEGVDPMKWLESLAQKQGANPEELITGGGMDIPDTDPTAADTGPGYESYDVDDEGESELDPDAVADPINWLNDLAEDTEPESFFDDWEEEEEEFTDASDPASWLGDLANDPEISERLPGFDPDPEPATDEKPSTGDPVADMINRGETPPPEMMQEWMSRQMDVMLSSEPLPIDEDEPVAEAQADADAPAAEGDLPDWLAEMAPSEGDEAPEAPPADEEDIADLEALFTQSEGTADLADFPDMPDFLSDMESDEDDDEPEPSPLSDEINVPDMPDWLMEDIPGEGDSLDSVFAEFEAPEPEETTLEPEVVGEIDAELIERLNPEGKVEHDDDPWVDALNEDSDDFDTESELPDWYVDALNDPDRRAAVESLAGEQLQVAELPPEEELSAGQREPLPDWLVYATGEAEPPVAEVEEEPAADDLPDWLSSDLEEDTDDEVPDWLQGAADDEDLPAAEQDMPAWLMETLQEDEEEAGPVITEEPEVIEEITQAPPPTPAKSAAVVPARQPAASPVPVPQSAEIDVAATLKTAREKTQSGDVAAALIEYESVIRANSELGTVVEEVSTIIKSNKDSAPAYRVLGDALMRQGKLQAALDTYRRALNML